MGNERPSPKRPDDRLDRLFEAFSEKRRRRALRILMGSSAPVAVVELAETIATEERDDSTGTTVESVVASLHHCHLPKLAEFGLVSYDGPDGYVEYTATDGLNDAVDALLGVDAQFE